MFREVVDGWTAMWSTILAALREAPFLGLGPDGYEYLGRGTVARRPQNLIMQFVVEWGLLGASIALILMAALFWGGFRQLRVKSLPGNAERIVSYTVLFAFTLYGLVDGVYYHAIPLALLAACSGVIFLPGVSSPVGTQSVRMRQPAVALATLCFSVMIAQSSLLANQLVLPTPSPTSFRAEIARVLPTTTSGLDGWLRDWRFTDPWASIEWAHWAHDRAANAHVFKTIEAGLLAEVGMRSQARQHAYSALSEAPDEVAIQLSTSLGDSTRTD
jgi:O-antigen ligase